MMLPEWVLVGWGDGGLAYIAGRWVPGQTGVWIPAFAGMTDWWRDG